MNNVLKWLWTFPLGVALVLLFPDWSFIGIAIMSFGFVAFIVDLIRSRRKMTLVPKENEIIVKVTWILLPVGTESPFRFNGWTDVGQVTMAIFSTVTNELTFPSLGGVIKTIKLVKGLNEVQSVINTDGSRVVTLMTIPSKFELWVSKHLGLVSSSEESKLKEDDNTPKIIYQSGNANG